MFPRYNKSTFIFIIKKWKMNLHYEQKLDKDSEFYDYYDEYDEGEEYENTDSVIENLVSDDETVETIDDDVDEEVDEEFEDSLPTSLL